MKLKSFLESGDIVVNQSPHGVNQDKKAQDFVGTIPRLKLVAPSVGIVERLYGIGSQSGFHFVGKGWDILFHHAVPVRTGKFVVGEKLGKSSSHHFHVSIKVNNKWDLVLNYVDRSTKLIRGVVNGTTISAKWANWDTYKDLHLPYTENIMNQEQKSSIEWNENAVVNLMGSRLVDEPYELSVSRLDLLTYLKRYHELVHKSSYDD